MVDHSKFFSERSRFDSIIVKNGFCYIRHRSVLFMLYTFHVRIQMLCEYQAKLEFENSRKFNLSVDIQIISSNSHKLKSWNLCWQNFIHLDTFSKPCIFMTSFFVRSWILDDFDEVVHLILHFCGSVWIVLMTFTKTLRNFYKISQNMRRS